ncbi:PREDICTED: uncharacterized protein LOC108762992 [Trachymyrmex cornetzi]|uniref:uncharacterized protein LOC108762992 n=1 Tax=Trachymyrmex cornetzi TaxID=471704 RepID=UPI00084EF564|nr:PREDICTED: uncharacterized protein LOC108762992 [Trachymyrmex cornetzi]
MNLAQISNSVILILAIAVLNSEEQNNFNITNYVRFPHYVLPVHYCIQLDYLIYKHIDDNLELDEAYNCNLPSNEFLTWIQYKHYPVVIWEQYEHSRVIKRISKSYNTTSYGKWLIPITLREISSLNENMWKICLKPNIGSSEFPTAILNKSWMVNIEQAGYYRIKYDSITWGNIAKYLNDTAGDYKSISVINRAKFIDDAFHLMMNRELDVSAFWNLTKFLSQETNFVVWYPMIKKLRSPILCLLPWWKHWTYCNGVAVTYSFTWTHIRDIWFKARNHTLLPFLTCFRYATPNTTSSLLLKRFQEEGQQDITNVRSYINIFHSVITKYSNTHDILEMIFRKLEIMKPEQMSLLTALVDIINHVYSSKYLIKIQDDYINSLSFRGYINKSQLLLIQRKISIRLSEIAAHTLYFRFISDL